MNGRKLAAPAAAAVVGALIGALAVSNPHLAFGLDGFRRMAPALVIWCLFFGYWAIAARSAAPTKRSESSASTNFHQVLLAGALLLALFPSVPGLTGQVLPNSGVVVAVGVTIQAGFALLGVWARRHLDRNWSAEVRIAVDHTLIRSGPYRMLRHPIYTAMLGMFAGTAIISGRVHALVALAIMAVAYRRKIRLEEQILLEAFGADYEAYRSGTWALVPWLV